MAGFGEGGFRRWRGDVNLATLLSLQILLLAFFILLTSMARFEGDRSRSVIDSVQAAFGPLVGPAGRGGAEPSDLAALRALRRTIGRLARTAIPLTRVEAPESADVMGIALPADAFFRPGGARVRPARRAFLKRLVAALDRRPAGYRYGLQVVLPGELPERLAVARAGAMVRALASAGAPVESLSAGIGPGGAGTVRFVIRLRTDPPPANLFDALAGES